jgi:hypothetical protein
MLQNIIADLRKKKRREEKNTVRGNIGPCGTGT